MNDLPILPPKLAALVGMILTTTSTVTSMLLTQSLIDNRTEKLVTGLASAVVPVLALLAFLIANAIHHAAVARVEAAAVTVAPSPLPGTVATSRKQEAGFNPPTGGSST